MTPDDGAPDLASSGSARPPEEPPRDGRGFDLRTPGRDAFRLLFATLLVVGVGNTMLLAVLPAVARELSLSALQMGAIFSFSALLWVLCSPLWGRRSDLWGRRRTVAIGLIGYAVSMAGIAAVAQIALWGWIAPMAAFVGLIMARAVFGAFGSAANPAAQAYVADHTTPETRTEEIAGLTSAFALGSALGPGLTVLMVGVMGPVAPLAATAVLAAVGAWVVLRYLPEGPTPPSSPHRQEGFGEALRLARDPRVSAHLVFGLGLSATTAIIAQTFGFYVMDRLNLSATQAVEPTGAAFMVGALAVLAAQTVLLPRLKLTPRGLMMLGSGLIGAGILVQILAVNLGVLLFSQLIQGLGFGLARPGFTGGASLAVRPDEQGAVAGLIVGVSGAGFVISPLAGGWLYDVAGHETPFVLCLVLTALMGLFAWTSRRLRAQDVAPVQPPDQGGV